MYCVIPKMDTMPNMSAPNFFHLCSCNYMVLATKATATTSEKRRGRPFSYLILPLLGDDLGGTDVDKGAGDGREHEGVDNGRRDLLHDHAQDDADGTHDGKDGEALKVGC